MYCGKDSRNYNFLSRVQGTTISKTLLEDCASSPENFYDAKDADELNEVFKEIARKTAKSIPYVSG